MTRNKQEVGTGVWVIRESYGYDAVEFVKETAQMIFYIERRWGKGRESRSDKSKFLVWHGTEEQARMIVAKLKSAKSEYSRRQDAASTWFIKRKDEILAIVDTHPKDGDVKQAPLVSSDGAGTAIAGSIDHA